MKPPRTLDVGPHRYAVKLDALATARAGVESRTNLLGQTDTETSVILLKPGQSASQLRDTLLHEALHAIWDQTALGEVLPSDAEEQVIRPLATALLDLLRRNPEVAAFLLAD